MKRYWLMPCCFLLLTLLGACMVSLQAPTATPAAQQALEPTFTATTTASVTNTDALTTTAVVTFVITPTGTLTTPAIPVASPTATGTASVAITATPSLTATAVATTVQGAATPSPAGQPATIAAILAARPEFATLQRALNSVQLVNELNGNTPYTLLAPTESAFARLPSGTLTALLADPSALTALLQNHLLIEEVASARLVRLGSVLTVLGQRLPVTLTVEGIVQVGDATVIEPDIEATNGVIHGIDTVLLPADLTITPTVANPTVTNPVTGVLTGTASAAQVTATQAVTTVQIITTIAPTATLADLVRETPELASLETALGAAGLLQALALPGQLTLFAPTNAAFDALPASQLQTLLNTTGALAPVMQYHLIADSVLADELVRLGTALSTTGQPLTITVAANGTVLVNNARVLQANIVATNGIIHLIDTVLSPPTEE